MTQPEAPTQEGYTFGGWFTDDVFENAFDFTTAITANTTLYARWSKATGTTYTVTFDTNGGNDIVSQTIDENGMATAPDDPTRAGFNFGGWYTDNTTFNNAFAFATTITADITLYAQWQAIAYTVIFNTNGGNDIASQTIAENGTATAPDDPTRAGFNFGGWYTDNTTFNNAFDFATTITANITLYAQWQAIAYTVIFNTNGGNSIASQTINENGMANAPVAPTRQCYTFGDWYTDNTTFNNAFDFATPIIADITLYAQWTRVAKNDNIINDFECQQNYTVGTVVDNPAKTPETSDKVGRITVDGTDEVSPSVIITNNSPISTCPHLTWIN